jgi:archaellin
LESEKSNFKWTSDEDTDSESELIKIRVTDSDINFVLETMNKEAPHDKVPIKQLFCGMSSAFTKTGIPHNVNSPMAGAGKNYLLALVASKFPDKYIEQLVGVSDKAFLHRRGESVIKNEETGELESVDPMIERLEEDIAKCEESMAEEAGKRNPEERNKLVIKENRDKIKGIQREIKDIQKRQQKLIDLNDLIIIISDTPQEGFFANLMSLMSQDSTRDQEYLFTDKTASGRAESTANILRGMPVIFSTQVIDDTDNKRFAEKNRRSILITPNTEEEKITAALDLIGKQAGLLPEEYDEKVVSREDQDRAKKIVAILVEKLRDHSRHLSPREYGIKVPFHSAIAHSIPGEGVWRMTVMKRIMGYLAIITKIHMDNRPRLVNTETGAFYPISTFEDLAETLELMEAGGSNLRAYLAKCYNEVILPAFKDQSGKVKENKVEDVVTEKETHVGLTTEEIGQAMHEKLGIPIPGTKQIRDTYLYPLVNHGLLNYAKSVLNRSENIWFPVDEETNAFSIFKDSNRKLSVSKQDVYPSQIVIEKEYSSIVKQDAERGTENKKILYRLQDADRSEITVSEMVQKYFSDPESCFTKGFEAVK